jgi:hypothetical protein
MANETKSTTLAAAEKELEAAIAKYAAAVEAEPQAQSAFFPESTMEAIINLINQSKIAFAPYDHSLAPADRKRLIGTRLKNLGFIRQAYINATANPLLVPPYLKIETFKTGIDDFSRKRNLDTVLKQFELQVSDSMLVASDVAYHNALGYYNAVKEATRLRVSGAEAAYNVLKDYFKRNRQASGKPTESEIERDVRSLLHGTKSGRIVIENEQPVVSGGEHRVVDEVHSHHIAFKEDLEEKVKN